MDLKQKTERLCQYYNIKPARARGQNFLVNEEVFDRIIGLSGVEAGDTVLEVGPGLGFLTTRLARIAKKVIAVELDDKLAEVLKGVAQKSGIGNIEVRNKSALEMNIPAELPLGYKIVANLPYQISSRFLRLFLESANPPLSMTLMLQKEVVERICARPGKMSLLALSVQFYARAEKLDEVPRQYFWPQPEVDSAIIRITPSHDPVILTRPLGGEESRERRVEKGILRSAQNDKKKAQSDSAKKFFRLARIGFSGRRKMLKNNLAGGLCIGQKEIEKEMAKAGFPANVRAQELSLSDWQKLLGVFGRFML